jgi:broad specificity phosphatase PhoE
MLRRTALALLLGSALGSTALEAQGEPLTVFVVRHAEKGPEADDPPLSAAGRQRAAELARVLLDAAPTALFATEFRRTQETLAPLVDATRLTPTLLPARDLDALIAALRALPAGSRAVVASHSNLVHLIVARLSGTKVPELTEADYDRLYVVTVTGNGTGTAVTLRYGER